MSTCDVEVSVSSWAAVLSAVTVTASFNSASWREIGISSGAADRTSTDRCTGSKPWTSTWISYGFQGTLKNWYVPAASVVVSALKPVMSFRSWTVAREHGAPVRREDATAYRAGGGGCVTSEQRARQDERERHETPACGLHDRMTPQLAKNEGPAPPSEGHLRPVEPVGRVVFFYA